MNRAGVAHLLLLSLGALAARRFYLGRPGTAILRILLNGILIGFIWVFVDLFPIPGMVRARQSRIRDRRTLDALSAPQATGTAVTRS